jgi:hypothetical protein
LPQGAPGAADVTKKSCRQLHHGDQRSEGASTIRGHHDVTLRTHSEARFVVRRERWRPADPFDLISALLRARLRGTPLASDLSSHFARHPDADLVWAYVASRHRITPALAGCLDDLGMKSALPAEFRMYLDATAAGNLSNNRTLRDQLHDVVQRLNGLAIVPCLLKGAARLVDDLYPDDTWRFMMDLDLLLPRSRIGTAVASLEEAGYVVCDPIGDGKPHHHHPPLVHPARGASVELHQGIGRGLQQRLLAVDEVRARIELRDTPLGRLGLLAPEDQVIYLIAHLQVEDGCWFQGTTRLRDLVELDLLIGRYGSELDWARLVGRLSGSGVCSACLSAFCTAHTLLGTPLPEILTAEFDPGVRRATLRVIRQERSSAMMRLGLAYGWTARHVQRLFTDPEHRRHLTRGWRAARFRNSLLTLRDRLRFLPY